MSSSAAGRYGFSETVVEAVKPQKPLEEAAIEMVPPSLSVDEQAQVVRHNNRQLLQAAAAEAADDPARAAVKRASEGLTIPELVIASGEAIRSQQPSSIRRYLAKASVAWDSVLQEADDGGAAGAVHALRRQGVNIRPSKWTAVFFNLIVHCLFIWAVLAVLYKVLVAGEERKALQGQFVSYSSTDFKQALSQAGAVSSAKEAAWLASLDPAAFAGDAPAGWPSNWDDNFPANLPETWRDDWPATWPALPPVTLKQAVKAALPVLKTAHRMVPEKDPTARVFNTDLLNLSFIIMGFLALLFVFGVCALRWGANIPMARMVSSALVHNLAFTIVISAAEGMFFWFVGRHFIPEPPSSIIRNLITSMQGAFQGEAAKRPAN